MKVLWNEEFVWVSCRFLNMISFCQLLPMLSLNDSPYTIAPDICGRGVSKRTAAHGGKTSLENISVLLK